ncbi:Uncharacterized protein FKW44_015241, partial [Caligus rogercresseyi]
DKSARSKTINSSLLNAKGLIARCITNNVPIKASDLRSIMISAAARYTALDLKIPSLLDSTWTLAAREVKFYPSSSLCHRKTIKRILKFYKNCY